MILKNNILTIFFSTFMIHLKLSHLISKSKPALNIYHREPDYHLLKVFGCMCWPNLRPYKHKLNYYGTSCVFLGYSSTHKGYKCLNLKTHRLYISRDVIFHEDSFPYSKSRPISQPYTQSSPVVQLPIIPSSILAQAQVNCLFLPHIFLLPFPDPLFFLPFLRQLPLCLSRPLLLLSWLHHILLWSQEPKQIHLVPIFVWMVPCPTPLGNTMTQEYNALIQNHTWTLVPRNPSSNALGCMWVYRTKLHV